MKKSKGFTLAELLIVVAIIAVLVAIAIPIFSNQLEKARESTDAANVRSAYAQIVTNYLTENTSTSVKVDATQKVAGWQTSPAPVINQAYNGSITSVKFNAQTSGNSYTISIDDSGSVTIN